MDEWGVHAYLSWCCGNYCWLTIVLWLGGSVWVLLNTLFLSHLMIASSAPPRNADKWVVCLLDSGMRMTGVKP